MIKAIRPSLAGVGVKQYQEFTASGTFNVPSTVNLVYITACGEGGGRYNNGGSSAHRDGDNTTFGSYLTVYGGGRASYTAVSSYPDVHVASINFGSTYYQSTTDENYRQLSFDVARRILVSPSRQGTTYYTTSTDTSVNTQVTNPKTPLSPYGDALGVGGNAASSSNTNGAAYCAEAVIREPIAVMPGEAITVTIGNGASNGGAGYLLVEWFE